MITKIINEGGSIEKREMYLQPKILKLVGNTLSMTGKRQ